LFLFAEENIKDLMSKNIAEELERRFLLQQEFMGTHKTVNQIVPFVSVTVTTYQQATYIGACLDSILMQKTDFPFEIIIGDDGSTDGTGKICIQYAEKYPDKIRLFIRDRSTSHYESVDRILRFNGIFTRMTARGRYTAICEGDDYWVDPNKLRKQIVYLERNENCSVCFHNAFIIDESLENYVSCFNIPGSEEIFTTKCLFENLWFIPTASIVYKTKSLPSKYPDWYLRAHNGDLALLFLLSKNGALGLVKGYLSVYRRNAINSQSLLIKKKPDYYIMRLIELINCANVYLNRMYDKEARRMCVKLKRQVLKIKLKRIVLSLFGL
jgi:glycosyltransferase involved in cell wall biosynthesis